MATKSKIYDDLVKMVPVKSTDKDYRSTVSELLKNYQNTIKELDKASRPKNWNDVLNRTSLLCQGINRALEAEFRGMRHSAYTSIKNQLDGYKTKTDVIKGLAYSNSVTKIYAGNIFYRMREIEISKRKNAKNEDLFHIPLDCRGIVKTQRYSVPGFPCLYLARRVYGCWEEMGQPNFGTIMVSKIQSEKNFKVLDLRIPSKEEWNKRFTEIVEFYPLIICSMIQVKNNSDTYKPEYTIPQILTEWVISHNKDVKEIEDKIIGIAYTSAQKNGIFDFPDDSFDNLAIPVVLPIHRKKTKFCPVLEDLFKVTVPTYYDLEVLKNSTLSKGKIKTTGLTAQQINMKTSPFGIMESFLDKYKCENIKS